MYANIYNRKHVEVITLYFGWIVIVKVKTYVLKVASKQQTYFCVWSLQYFLLTQTCRVMNFCKYVGNNLVSGPCISSQFLGKGIASWWF